MIKNIIEKLSKKKNDKLVVSDENDVVTKRRMMLLVVPLAAAVLYVGYSFYSTYNSLKTTYKKRAEITNAKDFENTPKATLQIDQVTALNNRIKKMEDQFNKEYGEKLKKMEAANAKLIEKLNKQAEKLAEARIEIENQKIDFIKQQKEYQKDKDMFLKRGKIDLSKITLPPITENYSPTREITKEQKKMLENIPKNITKKNKKVVKKVKKTFFSLDSQKSNINDNVEKKAKNNEKKQSVDEKKNSIINSSSIKKDDSNNFHMMLGIAEATLITGLDAKTDLGESSQDPLPALLSVNGESLIANNMTQDLGECLILGTATGDASTERAYIRLSRLSCVTKDGTKRIEASIKGWVLGADSKPGLSGNLVTKQGAIIVRGLAAGFLEGVANAFTAAPATMLSIGSTSTQQQGLGGAAGTGFSQGSGSAFKMLAKTYIDMMKKMYPVIEVKGGRKVQILINGGENLKEVPLNRVFVNSQYEVRPNDNKNRWQMSLKMN